MESRYPTGACEQLVALCALRKQERNLDRIGWRLWCARYPVTANVRASLARELRRLEARVRDGLERFEAEDPNNPIARSPHVRGAYGLGRVRRRVGPDRFSTFVRMGMDSLIGEFGQRTRFEDEDFAIVRSALGMTAKGSLTRGRSPEDSHVAEALEYIASGVNLIVAREAVERASDDDLERSRDEAQAIYRALFPLTGPAPPPLRMPLFLAWFLLRTLSPSMSRVIDEIIYQRPPPDLDAELRAQLEQMRSELAEVRRIYKGRRETERTDG